MIKPIKKHRYYIGVDCGTNTGFAVWDSLEKRFIRIETMMIHRAMKAVEEIFRNTDVIVIVEDARQIKLPAKYQKHQSKDVLQGVGSVKRDASIWEDFLTDLGIDFKLVAPRGAITKWSSEKFKQYTGWQERTNNHGRDAGLLVFNRNS